MTNTETQKFDKELETIQINEAQILAKNITVLVFAGMDVVIDVKNLEITEESIGNMDATEIFRDLAEFKQAVKSYVWMFNN